MTCAHFPKKNFLLFCAVLLFINISTNGLFAQSVGGACASWEVVIDTTSNLDSIEKLSRDFLPLSEGACRAKVLYSLGDVFRRRVQVDSAQRYYDSSIQLADSVQAWHQLVLAINRRAELEIKIGGLDSAAVFFKESKSILDKGYAPKAKFSYYGYMAAYMTQKHDYHSAIHYIDSALNTNHNIKSELGVAYNNKGAYYMRLGNYTEAIKQIQAAIEIKQQVDNADVASSYFMLGVLYTKTKQFEAAVKALEKAFSESKKNNNLIVEIRSCRHMAGAYRFLNKKEEALEMAEHALKLLEGIDNPDEKLKSYSERGAIANNLYKQHEEAEHYYIMAYNMSQDMSKFSRNQPTRTLVNFYLERKNFVKAKVYLDELVELNKHLNRMHHDRVSEFLQSRYYEGIGDAGRALTHLKEYHKIKDSMSNKEVLKQTAYYEKEFDNKQKELDILQLNEANRKQKEATLAAEALQKKYLYGSLLLGLLFFVGIYSAYVLRRQKKSLEQAHQQLSELNNIKDRFFSIIAHDLRGMIVPFQRAGKILGYHLEKGNTPYAIQLANELGNNANQLSSMLDNLLKWSLDQMDGYQINLEPMSVKEEFEIIVASFEAIAQHKSTNLELAGDFDEAIFFDKNAFHVIFRNLIGNALKFTENGTIKIDWKKSVNHQEFIVSDSGVGIEQTQLNHLFKLGHKERKTGTKGEKGTGLGLHLVHQFVGNLSGKITIESKVNQGTKCSLSFPNHTLT